jgi:CheY-like chemotaxis protein
MIQFAITDTGIGISPEKIESIFERFSQADSDTTRKFGGTGLGLSITRSLIALMGGQIRAESSLGKGSTFSFSIALEESHVDIKDTSASIESDVDEFRAKSIHVLLVEDNRVNQIVASGFLKAWGIKIDIANNGLEAVEMVRRNAYDVVFMDVQMPVMDGYEATQKIRALNEPYFKELPIIALTASAMLGMRDKALEVGMNEFITKPFVPASLKATIDKFVLQGKQPERSEYEAQIETR